MVMGVKIPHIVDKLPEYRERILMARFRSHAVDDLCRDYDVVHEALATGDQRRNSPTQDQGTIEQELTQLAKELVSEMLRWLEAHPEK